MRRAWRERDKLIMDLVGENWPDLLAGAEMGHDLDPNADLLMVFESVNEKKRSIHQRGPQSALMTHIVKFFSASIPSLVVQTGASHKSSFAIAPQCSVSLRTVLNASLAGSPVLFLDVRTRSKLKADDRSSLIEAAKQEFVAYDESLRQQGLADTFDVCALAFFFDALFGDGDASTSEEVRGTSTKAMPLHAAIAAAESGRTGDFDDQAFAPATSEQVAATANWLADQMTYSAFKILPGSQELEAKGDNHTTVLADENLALAKYMRLLLSSSNFHAVNLIGRNAEKSVASSLLYEMAIALYTLLL